jgi:hypothetical protein
VTDVLEPLPNAHDKRVLATVPPSEDLRLPWAQRYTLTAWQIAELLDTFDVEDLQQTLSGLAHLGYVNGFGRPQRWQRTTKGDEALA